MAGCIFSLQLRDAGYRLHHLFKHITMNYESRLKQRVRDIQSDLEVDKNKKKARAKDSREYRAFVKLPYQQNVDFFCRFCAIDFTVPAHRMWSFFYNCGAWHSYCPECGVEVVRNISDKTSDPYYEESVKIRDMRGRFSKDMLRPDQYGFKTLYGNAYDEYERRYEERREEIRSKYASMNLKGTILREKTEIEKVKEEFGIFS